MKQLDCDICVIGAGSGGLSVAAAASQFGENVVLIERGEMGGDCLNYGCVPSKALLAAGKHAHAFTSGEAFGIAAQKPKVNFGKVHDHVHSVIGAIAPHDSQERFEGLGVTVIRETGRFIDYNKFGAAPTFQYESDESTHNLFTSILHAMGQDDSHFGNEMYVHQGPLPGLV